VAFHGAHLLPLAISRAAVAEKVVEYLTFKDAYKSAGPKDDIPDFMERLPPELALELYV
jgi:transcription elongation factor B subunit 1